MNGSRLNILVANNYLEMIGGSEVFTYALIEELVKKGHDVEYFTFHKGFVSTKIENDLGVNYKSKNRYDLILANHNTCVEELFKLGCIIQTCHGIFPLLEQPCKFADGFVTISEEVQDHLFKKNYRSKLILNGINLDRFRCTRPIGSKLKTILSLSHSEDVNSIISGICKKLEINFLQLNKMINPKWNIEHEINKADLVIGLGRSAYDAMACGRTVIIFDKRNYMKESFGDGYVTANNIDNFIKNNCSGRYSNNIIDEIKLEKEILKYNPFDGKLLREFAENELSISTNVDVYLDFYYEIRNKFSNKFKRLNIILIIIADFKERNIYNLKVFIYNLIIKKH
ncbi:glycosyltransferase [Kaistella yonginensis]|uniref:glycosyltransferase n=1 Tax=Kaistella yonginensis TaxID=658267 RepID=UPI0025B5E773|nr:UDP-glycosyltransferase [Kaistella yonginensis]MDN3605673.1 UDP-glycosyltransferase [Kaistella yonginensis]